METKTISLLYTKVSCECTLNERRSVLIPMSAIKLTYTLNLSSNITFVCVHAQHPSSSVPVVEYMPVNARFPLSVFWRRLDLWRHERWRHHASDDCFLLPVMQFMYIVETRLQLLAADSTGQTIVSSTMYLGCNMASNQFQQIEVIEPTCLVETSSINIIVWNRTLASTKTYFNDV